MSKTVIGLFDDEKEAQEAVQALSHNGFNEEQVDCSTAKIPTMSAETRTEARADNDEDDNAVVGFFKSLFGDSEHTHKYTRAARGRTIITVHIKSDEEAAEAKDILDDCGAINIDEKETKETPAGQMRDLSIDARNEIDVDEHTDARLRSRIVDRPVEAQYRLRELRKEDEAATFNMKQDQQTGNDI